MKGKNVVVINGRHYDAATGVPLPSSSARTSVASSAPKGVFHDIGPAPSSRRAPSTQAKAPVVERSTHTSHAVHRKPQKSKTLHRAALKRPVTTYAAQTASVAAKSPMITKFGPKNSFIKPAPAVSEAASPLNREESFVHPTPKTAPLHTASKHVKPAERREVSAPTSRQLKEQLIKEKLEAAERPTKQHSTKHPLKRILSAKPRATSIVTMSLALVMLGGYLTYVNMPNLSVRVASARAGVDANFPEYHPDGYMFAGPVAYAPGEVTINFSSNSGQGKYQIKQKTSNWDSQAVLDNYVTRESKNYLTYSQQGLTIYTYGNKAAWVNGGVLYTINGDAPLSSEQVLRIAGSM